MQYLYHKTSYHNPLVRLSQYFLPTLKENPNEAQIISHRLMLRSGMIKQSASGLYSWLPLGLRVMQKIATIIRQEQDLAGAHEILMPTIQSAELWQESGRYEVYGKEMLRIKDRHERDLLYGPTNEEVITAIMRDSIKSYRNLPQNLYQIQWKFRDEIRPRFGVMRGREFYMKDGYSFDYSIQAGKAVYQKMFISYLKIFARLGLKAIPMQADTGQIGGDASHEFIILAETGESQVYCDKSILDLDIFQYDTSYDKDLSPIVTDWTKTYAVTEEKFNKEIFSKIPKAQQLQARGIEVGQIFFFGDKYSKPMHALVQNPKGELVPLQSGSYGIGVSRLVAAMIEANHDDNGIQWHPAVSPFDLAILNLNPNNPSITDLAETLTQQALQNQLEVILDDRDLRAGEKFKELDLIGISFQLIVGNKSLENNQVEIKNRLTNEKILISPETAISQILKIRQDYLR